MWSNFFWSVWSKINFSLTVSVNVGSMQLTNDYVREMKSHKLNVTSSNGQYIDLPSPAPTPQKTSLVPYCFNLRWMYSRQAAVKKTRWWELWWKPQGTTCFALHHKRGNKSANGLFVFKQNMLCPIKVNSNTIELTVPTSCYWVLDLLCVKLTTTLILNQRP